MKNTTEDRATIDQSIIEDMRRLEQRLDAQEKARQFQAAERSKRAQQLRDLPPEEEENSKSQRTSPVERERFGKDQATHHVSWRNTIFGSVTIGLDKFGMGKESHPNQFTMVVPLDLYGEMPDSITFTVKRELTTGIRLLRSQMSPVTDCTNADVSVITFPISWVKGERGFMMPETVKGKRDMDIVFMDTVGVSDGRKGIFVVLEVGISTKRGQLYLTFQRVRSGQVVRTTTANAEKFGLQTVKVGNYLCSVVPISSEDAFPGNNFFQNFKHLAQSTVELAISFGASVPLSSCVVAEWLPDLGKISDDLAKDGWVGANVEWFNVTWAGGGGFVKTDEGQSAFVHFKAIQDQNGKPVWKKWAYPIITPRKRLAVKLVHEEGQANPKAVAVCAI